MGAAVTGSERLRAGGKGGRKEGKKAPRGRLVNGDGGVGGRKGSELIVFIDGKNAQMANDREVKIEPSRVHFQSISYGISLSACVCFPHSSVCGGGEAGGNIAQEHLPARQRLGAHLSAGLGFISLGWKKHVEPRRIRSAE